MAENSLTPEEWGKKFRKIASWETAKFLVAKQKMIAIYFGEFDIVFYQKDDELINNGPWAALGPDVSYKIDSIRNLSKEWKAKNGKKRVWNSMLTVSKREYPITKLMKKKRNDSLINEKKILKNQ